MKNWFHYILDKISRTSMIFWKISLEHTPDRILNEKIAATLSYKNKLTGQVEKFELDVTHYQWYMDDEDTWREYYFEEIVKTNSNTSEKNGSSS